MGQKTVDNVYAAAEMEATPGDYLCIEISDTGTGIPQELKNRVFEPFFTTKSLGDGTGLGLSTAIGIVRSHGGFINVYSEPGKGTEFRIYLPLPPLSEITDDPKPASQEFTAASGVGKTILVVDDEASIVNTTRLGLEEFGYDVLVAANGTEALATFVQMQTKIDLVITDLMMPEMDGPALIAALKHIQNDLPIIPTSGLNANGRTAKAANLGVKNFLHKPYSIRELIHAIQFAFDSCR
jgi:CheY-like chemotaxis protein